MGAEYWTCASVRLVCVRGDLAGPSSLMQLGRFNTERDVWIWKADLTDHTALQGQLLEVTRFLSVHSAHLAEVGNARVNVFMGWSPDTAEVVVLDARLLGAVARLGGDIVVDVYNADSTAIDKGLLLEWIPANQDGLVLTTEFLQESARHGLDLTVRVNEHVRERVAHHSTDQHSVAALDAPPTAAAVLGRP